MVKNETYLQKLNVHRVDTSESLTSKFVVSQPCKPVRWTTKPENTFQEWLHSEWDRFKNDKRLHFITAGVSYFSSVSPTLRIPSIKLPKKPPRPVSFGSVGLKTMSHLYSLSMSEKHVNGMSKFDNAAAIDGTRLWKRAFNLPAVKVSLLISSNSSSLGT